jgi:hypothetical protein
MRVSPTMAFFVMGKLMFNFKGFIATVYSNKETFGKTQKYKKIPFMVLPIIYPYIPLIQS